MRKLLVICSVLAVGGTAYASSLWCGPYARQTNLGATYTTMPLVSQVAEVWFASRKQKAQCSNYTDANGQPGRLCVTNSSSNDRVSFSCAPMSAGEVACSFHRQVGNTSSWTHYARGGVNSFVYSDTPYCVSGCANQFGRGYIVPSGEGVNRVAWQPEAAVCP